MSLIPPEDDYEVVCFDCDGTYVPGWTNCKCTPHRVPKKLGAAMKEVEAKIAAQENTLPKIPPLWAQLEEEIKKEPRKPKKKEPPKDLIAVQEGMELPKPDPKDDPKPELKDKVDAELDKLAERWFD